MSQGRLKTALIGLDEQGQFLLETISKIDYFLIDAVADRDVQLAEKTAEKYSCSGYDDYRQLIIQNQFDCLIVAAGLYTCDEYVRAAIKKKFNILKLSPAARSFEEACEFVNLAETNSVAFAVANIDRFAQSFSDFSRYLEDNKVEQTFMINAALNIGSSGRPAWQGDPKLSGGGVLLRDGYYLIDQIVLNFGLPEQVYCLATNTAGEKQQRVYLTEETALVTMKFNPGLSGNFIASRQEGIGQDFEIIKVHSKDVILSVNRNRFTISDISGNTTDDTEYDFDKSICLAKVLNNFALSILSPEEHKLKCSGKSNLKTMAVIESAYLSSRTAMPEEPARIMQIAETENEQLKIWPGHME